MFLLDTGLKEGMIYFNLRLVVRKSVILNYNNSKIATCGIEEVDNIKMHFMELISEDGGLVLAVLKRRFQCPRNDLAGHFAGIYHPTLCVGFRFQDSHIAMFQYFLMLFFSLHKHRWGAHFSPLQLYEHHAV